ncbi:hypothetical protein PanWU01x14_271070 [Parasponia andersonii]|uniref:Uncharacterized protein n=1 Tax=Parasponia andersonii TaxID=3476 RepID=A0A2P5B4W0_PARAD|nr:hypothetical protein PanWU01x14_271070 [Parasponia andersonii]
MVDNVLWPIDMEVIKTIPFSIWDREDSMIWYYKKNGSYTVRSEYNLLLREVIKQIGPNNLSLSLSLSLSLNGENSFGTLTSLLRFESSFGELSTRPNHLGLISSIVRSPSTAGVFFVAKWNRAPMSYFLVQLRSQCGRKLGCGIL